MNMLDCSIAPNYQDPHVSKLVVTRMSLRILSGRSAIRQLDLDVGPCRGQTLRMARCNNRADLQSTVRTAALSVLIQPVRKPG